MKIYRLLGPENFATFARMCIRTALIQRIDNYCAEHGITAYRFGLEAVRDHKFIARVRAGKVTLATIERAEAYMRRDHATAPTHTAEDAA